jgi:hypothetical protein
MVRIFLLRLAILGHMNRKLAARIHKHGKALNRLAPATGGGRESSLASNLPE